MKNTTRLRIGSAAHTAGCVPAVRPSRRAFSHAGGKAAHARGFTLIEIILATLLLALGLTIAFASLHSANGSVQRADAAAGRNEHLRAVQGLLYRTLQAAQPLVLSRDPVTQQATFFDGAHDKLRLVAPMPGYMSRGGPYVITLKIVPSQAGDGTQKLQFAYAMLVNEKPLEVDDKRPAEDVLDGIADARFEYRGLDQSGDIGSWEDHWDRPSELPLQVRLKLHFARAGQPWPEFATALPLGFASAHAENATGAVRQLHPVPTPSVPAGGGQ